MDNEAKQPKTTKTSSRAHKTEPMDKMDNAGSTDQTSASSKSKSSKKTNPKFESFKVKGDQVVNKVKELVKEGNARKIIIKDKNNKTIAEFPMTVGVVGAMLVPILTVIGTVAALVSECTIEVEKR